MREVHWKQEYT